MRSFIQRDLWLQSISNNHTMTPSEVNELKVLIAKYTNNKSKLMQIRMKLDTHSPMVIYSSAWVDGIVYQSKIHTKTTKRFNV